MAEKNVHVFCMGSTGLHDVTEDAASRLASKYEEVIYFFAELAPVEV